LHLRPPQLPWQHPANSTQDQLQALNTALYALGLNNTQLAQIASLIQVFNPLASTLATPTPAPAATTANTPATGTPAAAATTGSTAGGNTAGGSFSATRSALTPFYESLSVFELL